MDQKSSYLIVVDTLKMDINRYFYELEELLANPDGYQAYFLDEGAIVLITLLDPNSNDYLVRLILDNYKNELIDELLAFLADRNIDKFLLSINCLQNVDINYLRKKNLIYKSERYSFVKLTQSEQYVDKNIRELKESDLDLALKTTFPAMKYRPPFKILFQAFVQQKGGRILAYLHDDRIIGYLSFLRSFANYWDVDYVYVAHEYRKRGIGTSLAKTYSQTVLNENMVPYWSNATKEDSGKTALKAGFELCCKHWYFERLDTGLPKKIVRSYRN